MPQLLKMPQLPHQHSVAQVQVGRGRVEAGFHAQRAAGLAALFKALAEVADADDLGGAFLEQVELVGDGWEGGHVVFKYKVAGVSEGGERPGGILTLRRLLD